MSTARFIYDVPYKNADLYYATHFLAHDHVIYFDHKDKKYLVMNDLEIDRAKNQANVDHVLSLSLYLKKARQNNAKPSFVEVLHEVFKDNSIKNMTVPESTSFAIVDELRTLGYSISAGPTPFFPERYVKSREEKSYILASQRMAFAAIRMAEEVLRKARIKGNRIVYKGNVLTSESLRTMIEIFLLEKGYPAGEAIVSCGRHSIDPHDVGSGPLYPHQTIILDICPQSSKTRYYGDTTRTFCKGRATDAMKKMYQAVKKAQEMALGLVRAGVVGNSIHRAVSEFFVEEGYPTEERGGRMVGFFHGTGHSIGLEIHEEPARINWSDYHLKVGNVMSVEPGLYYPEIGGVRIEDLVYVTDTGCEILGKYPKRLEIA